MPLAASPMAVDHELMTALGQAVEACEALFADARSAVATSPSCRAGFTLAAKTHAAIPNGQHMITEKTAMTQRGDTAATCGGALGGGGCHVGVPAPCWLYEAPPGFQSSDIEFPFSSTYRWNC